jgi:hypothetical protein
MALVAVAAACSSTPTEGALQGKSPTAIVSTSIVAFHHQKSFHFVTKTVTDSSSTVQIGDISGAAAVETIQSGNVPVLQSVLAAKTVYIRAGASFLQNTFSLPASAAAAHAGMWISLDHGDGPYASVVSSLSATSAIQVFVPEEPDLRVGGATKFAGQDVVAIEGSPSGTLTPGTNAVDTLFVSTTSPYLPVAATLVITSLSGKVLQREASVFGKWNDTIKYTVPKSTTPFASIAG